MTAKGKEFYDRLKKRNYMALTGMKGEDTMHCGNCMKVCPQNAIVREESK